MNYENKILDRVFLIPDQILVLDGLEKVFDHIVKSATHLLNAEAATLRIFDVSSGALNLVKGYGLTQEFLSQPQIKFGEGITGKVVETQKPFVTTCVSRNPNCKNAEVAQLEGIRSVICVPLPTPKGSIGCITVYRKCDSGFSEHELRVLNQFASDAINVIEKIQLIEQLKAQATLDSLTGLLNKKSFIDALKIEIERNERHNQDLALLFIDLDNFKYFNDQNGHLMGDKLIYDFSQLLRQHCRKIDILGRFGGDEFVIIAPQTSLNGAINLAEKIRLVTENNIFHANAISAKKRITCSIGVALQCNESNINALLSNADQALFKSKRNGRNNVSVFNSQESFFPLSGVSL